MQFKQDTLFHCELCARSVRSPVIIAHRSDIQIVPDNHDNSLCTWSCTIYRKNSQHLPQLVHHHQLPANPLFTGAPFLGIIFCQPHSANKIYKQPMLCPLLGINNKSNGSTMKISIFMAVASHYMRMISTVSRRLSNGTPRKLFEVIINKISRTYNFPDTAHIVNK